LYGCYEHIIDDHLGYLRVLPTISDVWFGKGLIDSLCWK